MVFVVFYWSTLKCEALLSKPLGRQFRDNAVENVVGPIQERCELRTVQKHLRTIYRPFKNTVCFFGFAQFRFVVVKKSYSLNLNFRI